MYPYVGWEYFNQCHRRYLKAAHDGAYDLAQRTLAAIKTEPTIKAVVASLEQGRTVEPAVLAV